MKLTFKIVFLLFSLSFYGQNDTLAIIRHTDKDIIVNKNSKIVYRGIPNILSIEVPNCKSFTSTGLGLTKNSKNEYNLNPGAGTEVIVTIDIVLKNNKKIVEKHLFEIRNVKSAISCFNYTKGDTVLRLPKKSFNNGKVTVISPDKNLEFKVKISQFSLKIPGRKSIIVDGDTIDEKTFQDIIKYSFKGNQIIISDIKTQLYNWSGCFLVNPMVIEVY